MQIATLFRVCSIAGIMALSSANHIQAQSSRQISYQGVVTQGDTKISDGWYSLTFALYGSVGSSTPLWQEEQRVYFRHGLFNVMLGAAHPLPEHLPDDAWIGISFQGSGEFTRTKLTAVPFALQAEFAANAMRAEKAAELEGGVVTGINGIQGNVLMKASDGLEIRTDEDGGLIVGLSNEKRYEGILNQGTEWLLAGNSNANANSWLGTSNNFPLVIRTNNAERMRILSSNGNIGIGTISPAERVHIAGNAQIDGNVIIKPTSNTTGELRIMENGGAQYTAFKSPQLSSNVIYTLPINDGNNGDVLTSDGSGVLSWQSADGWGLDGNTVGAGQFLGTLNAQPLSFRTNNAERMIIGTTGNVAIGEQTTSSKLTVAQSLFITNTGGTPEIKIEAPNNTTTTIFKTTNQNANIVYTLPPDDGNNGQFLRTNGSGVLTWAEAGGLNHFSEMRNTTAPNATHPAHSIQPFGTEQNIDLVLSPKGMGAIIADMPDLAAAGGIKRGAYAVDWQRVRHIATRVASGVYSTIGGGMNNMAATGYSVVGGGEDNTAIGVHSTVGGGRGNTASGDGSTVGGGHFNTASGDYTIVSGGSENTASGDGSTVGGGRGNTASGSYSIVVGGWYNTANGDYSVISGGRGLILDANADRSFGFHANNVDGTRNMTISAANTAVFGNVDFWLANNDNSPRSLRFYEQYNAAGNFPNGANYVGFRAPNNISADITYTLPASAPTNNGQVLSSTTAGVLSWITPSGGGTVTMGGDLSGSADNAQIIAGAIGSAEIADNAILTNKIADGNITMSKLSQSGATNGQVLKWNGSAWSPSVDANTEYSAGTGISIVSGIISSTGDTDGSDDIVVSSTAGGDVSGTFSNLQIIAGAVGSSEIADNAILTSKIADGNITMSKLSQSGATNGQVLKWNGSAWSPSVDANTEYSAGTGISIVSGIISSTGDTDGSDDIVVSSTAGGDVSGTFSNLQIIAGAVGSSEIADNAILTNKIADGNITMSKLSQSGATNGQVLKWNGSAWSPSVDANTEYSAGTGISIVSGIISSTGDTDGSDDIVVSSTAGGDVSGTFSNLQIIAGAVGSSEIADNAILTSKIADGNITMSKLSQSGATNGQVLKWNGSAWSPSGDNSGMSNFSETRTTSSPNETRPVHQLSVVGSETHIDMALSPKGEGALTAHSANNAVSGGNKRGQYAVDFQTSRSAASQIASGTRSSIGGGEQNTASGGYSRIGGGYANIASGSNTVVSGGLWNTASNLDATISGGRSNTASGMASTIAGGESNLASGEYSFVGGGVGNQATGARSSVIGGYNNRSQSSYSVVLGGMGMTLNGAASNTFGFLGANGGNNNMTIAAANTGVLANVDVWLANNDGTARELRFYEPHYNSGNFPNGTNYVAFKAPNNISTDIAYTLPVSAPTSNGQVLSSTTSGVLSWVSNLEIELYGDIQGTSENTRIGIGAVDSASIANNAVSSVHIENYGITSSKIAYSAINSTHLSDSIVGDRHLTATGVTAGSYGGDVVTVAGVTMMTFPVITVNSKGRVTDVYEQTAGITMRLDDNSVTDTHLDKPLGITNGATFGSDSTIAQISLMQTGRVINVSNVPLNLGGDVSGGIKNVTVTHLQHYPIDTISPDNGQVLQWNGSAWSPSTKSLKITVNNFDPDAVNAASFANFTVTANGVTTNDVVSLHRVGGFGDLIIASAYVNTNNQVTIRVYNPTASSVNLGAETLIIGIIRE